MPRLLPIDKVADRTGLTRQYVYRLVKEGRFPQSAPVAGNRRCFIEDEVETWIAARIAERGTPADLQSQAAASERGRHAVAGRWGA